MQDSDELVLLVWCHYPTHTVYVYQHVDSGHIHCIKYNDTCIEWQDYVYEEWSVCKEYMIRPCISGGFQYVYNRLSFVCN